jgi:hypothetical protein
MERSQPKSKKAAVARGFVYLYLRNERSRRTSAEGVSPAGAESGAGGRRKREKKRGGLEKQDGGGRGSCFPFFFVNLSSLFSLRRPNETGPWGGKAVAGRREGEGTGCCES